MIPQYPQPYPPNAFGRFLGGVEGPAPPHFGSPFYPGDACVDYTTGTLYICTVGGNEGTWIAGGGGYVSGNLHVTGSLIVEGNTNTNTVIGTTTVQGDFDVEGTTRLEGRVDLTVGKLTTAASDTPQAGFNLPQGVAPTTPVNGDVWMTALGLFYRSGGTTKGPL